MEDVLEVYQRPYDPLTPVVCIDETNKQLIQETRIPCEPGQPEKIDSEYVRNGVADVFMICEPLAGKRETVVTQTRREPRKDCVKENKRQPFSQEWEQEKT